jgi:hypothetical protein
VYIPRFALICSCFLLSATGVYLWIHINLQLFSTLSNWYICGFALICSCFVPSATGVYSRICIDLQLFFTIRDWCILKEDFDTNTALTLQKCLASSSSLVQPDWKFIRFALKKYIKNSCRKLHWCKYSPVNGHCLGQKTTAENSAGVNIHQLMGVAWDRKQLREILPVEFWSCFRLLLMRHSTVMEIYFRQLGCY